MGRDPFHQPRVLRALSSLALSPARERAATASLGSLGQGLTTLMGKNFFLISNLNLPSFSLEPFPLVLSLHPLVNHVSLLLRKVKEKNSIATQWLPRSVFPLDVHGHPHAQGWCLYMHVNTGYLRGYAYWLTLSTVKIFQLLATTLKM